MPRILYVEDNEDNAYMLRRRLERRGFEVAIAADGCEGITMATAEPPDLFIMDLGLPVLDGWEATRRLRSLPETRSIPIIALSAHAMSADREEAALAGTNDYESKPVDMARLMTKIEALLAKTRDT